MIVQLVFEDLDDISSRSVVLGIDLCGEQGVNAGLVLKTHRHFPDDDVVPVKTPGRDSASVFPRQRESEWRRQDGPANMGRSRGNPADLEGKGTAKQSAAGFDRPQVAEADTFGHGGFSHVRKASPEFT
jgi:hypothetical protein